MAGSKYAYVKSFELPDSILPNTFMVLRLDGHSFHRFSEQHSFAKPNDERALRLMDHAAQDIMNEHKDIVLAFGESDEFSFLLRRSTSMYNRRQSKILTTLTSQFTSSYVFHWSEHFPDTPLIYPPSFDGRIVLYPGEKEVRDYFAWRQVDTHINNLYNTTFWALIQEGGLTSVQAHSTLRGTVSGTKHDILFSRHGINYNDLPARYRKGSVLVRDEVVSDLASVKPMVDLAYELSEAGDEPEMLPPPPPSSECSKGSGKEKKAKASVKVLHVDIIGDEFWNQRPKILNE